MICEEMYKCTVRTSHQFLTSFSAIAIHTESLGICVGKILREENQKKIIEVYGKSKSKNVRMINERKDKELSSVLNLFSGRSRKDDFVLCTETF